MVIARDGSDAGALERRMAVREAHLAEARRLKAAGHILQAGAMLDDAQRMVGSVLLVAFDSRDTLNDWLAADPYVMGNVWQDIEVKPFRLAPI